MRDGRRAQSLLSGAGQTHRVTCAAVNRNRIQSAWPMMALLLTLTIPLCAQQVSGSASSAIFSGVARVWLPIERRHADEPDDDWKWTLRSTANRPLLR